MSDRYRLVALGNDELVVAVASLLRRETELVSDLLAHLAELDGRRLYLELGFTSMFAYCTDGLGLCKSSAYRRIAAARVCRQYPEVFARVAAGELQTSVLATLARYLTLENATRLFDACSRKSCEQVEELLAIRFPKADVADSIRRLPARTLASPKRDDGSSMGIGGGSSMGMPPSSDLAFAARRAALSSQLCPSWRCSSRIVGVARKLRRGMGCDAGWAATQAGHTHATPSVAGEAVRRGLATRARRQG